MIFTGKTVHFPTNFSSNGCEAKQTSSSAEQKIIPARGKALVDTQISIAVPAGTYGRVAPRSGLGSSSFRSGLLV